MTLDDRGINSGEFEFRFITDYSSTAMLENGKDVVRNVADVDFAFDTITFEEPGTYYYTVVESNNRISGITYDTRSYTVKVVVTDVYEEGKLVAEVEIINASTEKDVDKVVFTNTYKKLSKPDELEDS